MAITFTQWVDTPTEWVHTRDMTTTQSLRQEFPTTNDRTAEARRLARLAIWFTSKGWNTDAEHAMNRAQQIRSL